MFFTLNDSDFNKIKTLIYDKSGIHFSENNRSILESRLYERLKSTGFESIAEYYNLIIKQEEEMKILLDSVTTNLTRFFRNKAHMQAFEYYIIPELVEYKRKTGNKTVTFWSAGCSTGEEAYSLAIIIKEVMEQVNPHGGLTMQIFATDMDNDAIETARKGIFPVNIEADVSPKRLSRFFTKTDEGYRINTEMHIHGCLCD